VDRAEATPRWQRLRRPTFGGRSGAGPSGFPPRLRKRLVRDAPLNLSATKRVMCRSPEGGRGSKSVRPPWREDQ
jgi:hypothetical protein